MKKNLALMFYVYFRRFDVGQFTIKSFKKETRDVSLFFHYILTMCLMIFRDGARSEKWASSNVAPSSIYSWFLKPLYVLHSRFPTKKS